MSRKLLFNNVDKVNIGEIEHTYNHFMFDTSLIEGTTIELIRRSEDDYINRSGLTDWGDGTINRELSHTYAVDGTYEVKTKCVLGTRDALISCLDMNREMRDLSGFFSDCINLTYVNPNMDTSKVDRMTNMFYGCSSLKSLDLSGFNTSGVNRMENMFRNCSSLESLNISSFDVSKVQFMQDMFRGCSSLKSLDLSSFDDNQVTDMSRMFRDCHSLESVNVSKLNTDSVFHMTQMFYNCYNLKSLDLSNFKCNSTFYRKHIDLSYMFGNCRKLELLNLSKWNLSGFEYDESKIYAENIINLKGIFADTYALTLNNIIMTNCDEITISVITEAFNNK